MLRMWVLTVFGETDSSLAISGRERLAGRYRSTLSVAFCVGQRQGPRLGGAQIHQRHRAQVAAQGDVLIGRPGHRGGQEPGLLDDAGQVTAPPGQRQLERRDRHPEAALAIWWRRLGVRLGDRQMGGRFVQASLDKVNCRAHQGQLGMIRARREGPQQRLHGLRLPVERQAERLADEQPGRARPNPGPAQRDLGD
jgi:hypothetical protein